MDLPTHSQPTKPDWAQPNLTGQGSMWGGGPRGTLTGLEQASWMMNHRGLGNMRTLWLGVRSPTEKSEFSFSHLSSPPPHLILFAAHLYGTSRDQELFTFGSGTIWTMAVLLENGLNFGKKHTPPVSDQKYGDNQDMVTESIHGINLCTENWVMFLRFVYCR